MTSFAKYPLDLNNNEEVISMSQIESLIQNESNKIKITEVIYHRYNKRYIKPFSFPDPIYQKEYKNGFAMMTNCCLLIETLSSFLEGNNTTPQGDTSNTFKKFFEKANQYNNPLKIFKDEPFYKAIRCALLHQGETYQSFKIRRSGPLFDKPNKTINATEFMSCLEKYLLSYTHELTQQKWDGDMWDKCRIKIRHIINNSRQ